MLKFVFDRVWKSPLKDAIAVQTQTMCSRRSQTPNAKLLERVYSQIRRHMSRHIGPTRWHHKEDDEDVEHDEHDEHGEHGDAKRDQTWRH